LSCQNAVRASPKLTPHQRQEAIARRESDETLVDIARSYNVSHPTIMRLFPSPFDQSRASAVSEGEAVALAHFAQHQARELAREVVARLRLLHTAQQAQSTHLHEMQYRRGRNRGHPP
jgi:hypothetical protein